MGRDGGFGTRDVYYGVVAYATRPRLSWPAPKAQSPRALGQRPRFWKPESKSSESAIHASTGPIIIRASRGIEARFQRLFPWESNSLGAMPPQATDEIAPLALGRTAPQARQKQFQSPPLKPTQRKNAEQPARDRCGLRNDGAIDLDVIDLVLEIVAV